MPCAYVDHLRCTKVFNLRWANRPVRNGFAIHLLVAQLEVAEASLREELSTVPMPADLGDDVEAILQADPSKSCDQAVRKVAAKVNL